MRYNQAMPEEPIAADISDNDTVIIEATEPENIGIIDNSNLIVEEEPAAEETALLPAPTPTQEPEDAGIIDNSNLILENEPAAEETVPLPAPPAPTQESEGTGIIDNTNLIVEKEPAAEAVAVEQPKDEAPKVDTPPPVASTPPVVGPKITAPETTPPVAPVTPKVETEVRKDIEVEKKVEEIKAEEATPVPAEHVDKDTEGVPERVLALTSDELDAARRLWAREHIAGARAQSNSNRKAHMNDMMDAIEKIVRANSQTTVHSIANQINLSEKLTSGYLQKLVHAGRIKATGNTNSRRYYL